MPIHNVADLRAAIRRADIPQDIRNLALESLSREPDGRCLDVNAVRAFFWFGPAALREYAQTIIDAGET